MPTAGQYVEHLRTECHTNDAPSISSLVMQLMSTPVRARALPAAILALTFLAGGSGTVAANAVAAAPTAAGWDAAQQRQVAGAGLMSESGGSFNGAGRLSATQANAAMAALASRLQAAANEHAGTLQGPEEEPSAGGEPATPSEPSTTGTPAASAPPTTPVAHTSQSQVTVVTFDRMLVEQLGLTSVAAHVQAVAAGADLHPPSYFGTEVAARFLELRYEHPVGSQRLDIFPNEQITRAEAAWSLAKVMELGDWSVSSAQEALSAFELPQMSAAQRQALQIAVSRIGYPYVWGGTTDNTADGLEHGGL
jgi:hypothetical protein